MSEFDTQENLLSLHFGRTFWLNEEGEFCSAPTYKNGKTDWERWDYVSDWDMEGVNFDRLFDVHRTLIESRMYEQFIKEHKMKIEVNKEQLELLKYAILWYECNDKEEERVCEELETKLYNAQEQDLLRSVTNMGSP